MPHHILFVDDDALMLAGLGRRLRPMRHEWEMTFASGGTAAMAAIDVSPYDAIVSDMRMPDADGVEVLRHAHRIQPRAMRLVLSGQANCESSLRLVQTAHQCLSKPCESAVLIGKIRGALAWRNRLGGEDVAAAVSDLTALPSRPESYRHLLAELQTASPSTRRLVEIIGRDLAMTCKILQIANSTFFHSHRGSTVSVGSAVSSLGLDVVRQLALSAGVFNELNCQELLPFIDDLSGFSIEPPDDSSVGAISKKGTGAMVEAAPTGGPLHEVGQLVLAAIYGPRYGEILRRAQDETTPLWCVERDQLGTSHEDVGAYLLALWGIPGPVMNAEVQHRLQYEEVAAECSPATVVHQELSAQYAAATAVTADRRATAGQNHLSPH